MHADELRQAVDKVVELLRRSDIRRVLDHYRAARGEDRAVASARLGLAGATIMDGIQELSSAERRVVRLMHLEELGTTEYWRALVEDTADAKAHQRDIVRLASRVMFAAGQLPALVSLLEQSSGPGEQKRARPLPHGEARFVVRLADAGERAADPERVARSIEGVDMLYSACATIARKPAVNLRLDAVDGIVHRDLHFSGDSDSLSAVAAVVESIPAVVAGIDPRGEADLEAIIASLPVFEDLDKLGAVGVFSPRELKDIGETMHQGALLVLESGAVPVDENEPRTPTRLESTSLATAAGYGAVSAAADGQASAETPATNGAAMPDDVAESAPPEAASTDAAATPDAAASEPSGTASADESSGPESAASTAPEPASADEPSVPENAPDGASDVAATGKSPVSDAVADALRNVAVANGSSPPEADDGIEPAFTSGEALTTIGINGDEHYERYLREREAMQSMVTESSADRKSVV